MNSHSRRINLWPVSIIAFFTVAIIWCSTFIVFCSRHPADLISANYYEEEVRYQGHINRVQQTQERAPLASIVYDAAVRRIRISLPVDASQSKVVGKIELYRPSAANLDRQMNLEVDAGGIQAIDAASLLPGLWKVRVTWTADSREYFIDQKIVVPWRI